MAMAVGMRRARSVTGPLRRAHPASGATWNVQVVRGKMSSTCLWHACRALSAGLLLMLLGAAMATIGYYADSLSVAEEVRGNATVSVKDEARGFHLNNLSYAGPIVMGFGGFIVVAACVMTFEARDSAAKVTPARPQSMPRPSAAGVRRGAGAAAAGCASARLDQLGVYRLPHVLPLPHALPLAMPLPTLHRHRPRPPHNRMLEKESRARGGSAPDLRAGAARAPLSAATAALRRPLRRYALSVDEPTHSAVSGSAVESECGSQSSLALELHGSGACAGATLRVRDSTRRPPPRRPLARQQRLHDTLAQNHAGDSTLSIHNFAQGSKYKVREGENMEAIVGEDEMSRLVVEHEARASSAPLPSPPRSPRPPQAPQNLVQECSPRELVCSPPPELPSPPQSPRVVVTPSLTPPQSPPSPRSPHSPHQLELSMSSSPPLLEDPPAADPETPPDIAIQIEDPPP